MPADLEAAGVGGMMREISRLEDLCMEWDLDQDELRVLGSLMEKSVTTPDQYPLSVNALMNACNQKSARDPVMSLTPGDVRAALGRLTRRGLVRMAGSYGGRVSKYEHRLVPSQKGALAFTPEQYAVVCVLILRGPQTPGEIRSRSQRLADFPDTSAVEAVLEELRKHETGTLVERLAREPGKRESRYRHLLGTSEPALEEPSAEVVEGPHRGREDSLEDRVARLESEVAELKALLRDGKSE